MAYRNDVAALGPDHQWVFDGTSADSIGTASGTDSGVDYPATPISEDAASALRSDLTTDRVTIPSTTDINGSMSQKVVAGWFMFDSIQDPPKRIYGEGDADICFQFTAGWGNNIMLDVYDGANFTVQVFGPSLRPNRAYHLCGVFDGSGGGNEVALYVDGVKQTSSEPSPPSPGVASISARGAIEFGDPAGTSGVGNEVVILNGPENGLWNHWATWSGSVLTATQIRETLFEKGALPDTTITTGTQSAMQTQVDGLANTTRPDVPLCLRVEPVSGGGNFELSFDNISFDSRASIHVQYTGTDTLTIRQLNGTDVVLVSTPNGGSVVLVTPVSVTVTVKDVATFAPIQGARVRLNDGSSDFVNALTDVNGQVTTTYDWTTDVSVTGVARKGSSPAYKSGSVTGTITKSGLAITVLLVPDE